MIRAGLRERLKATGRLQVFSGSLLEKENDQYGNLIKYSFDRKKKVIDSQNTLCVGIYQVLLNLNSTPCVIAVGNGDNGTVNGTGGLVDPLNAPNINDTTLNNELSNGRFACLSMQNRYDSAAGIATFNSIIPAASPAVSPDITVTEWGLFGSQVNSVALNNKDAGYLMARRAEVFTKTNPDDDLDVLWTITFSLT